MARTVIHVLLVNTYFNPQIGHELSVVTGLTYNFRNLPYKDARDFQRIAGGLARAGLP
jgi:hypothetical protein